ncbi:UDP-4-amino-4,6-dideoxy-N-acetyl-beta-L-altrosamine transaminase [Nitrincola sp. MINF-07-Sa-05]|uniref:UDP-4-amino-4, 6-dideoxy-N-acetyl-beta-L-altrosamine transaminase n=1 Tax=Nitrincola salilacus TaxID=3400273 RepID=UPI003917E3C3
MIPYGRQDIQQEDIDAVIRVLKSDFLTQGPAVQDFEQALANYCDVPYAVAVNSATSALHLACLALDLGEGDWLWTSPITFVASANCGRYCGAQVDFVDIDPLTGNLCPNALEKKLINAEQTGRLPSIVIPVHLGGQPCDMAAIKTLADRFGFRIIEDASHAIGAQYRNEHVGNCQYSDITVFSFHPVKIITTAEGGVATTRNQSLAAQMVRLRSHGITRDTDMMTHAPDGPWYYQQLELGYNYRMSDLQAALGLSQLQRLDHYIRIRQELATQYNQALKDLPLTPLQQHPDTDSAWHLYIVRLSTDKIQVSHRQVFEAMREQNIGVNLHYIPVHLQPYYQSLGFKPGDFPEAEKYYSQAISLPLYPKLTDAMHKQVVEALKNALLI